MPPCLGAQRSHVLYLCKISRNVARGVSSQWSNPQILTTEVNYLPSFFCRGNQDNHYFPKIQHKLSLACWVWVWVWALGVCCTGFQYQTPIPISLLIKGTFKVLLFIFPSIIVCGAIWYLNVALSVPTFWRQFRSIILANDTTACRSTLSWMDFECL